MGQSLVEFALVFPLFLLLLFGLLDVGRLVYMNSVISQAAREGARLASVEASWIGQGAVRTECTQQGGTVVCPASAAALQTDVVAAANRMVSPFGSIAASKVYISCDGTTPPTGAWTTYTCASHDVGDLVSVRVLLSFTPITPVISSIVGPVTTVGSATMTIN
ncbi:MAG: pilus assembly protein [Chloroflexi bacterium]|nr:pilus assembly protein [Chloroflexota bacterium]